MSKKPTVLDIFEVLSKMTPETRKAVDVAGYAADLEIPLDEFQGRFTKFMEDLPKEAEAKAEDRVILSETELNVPDISEKCLDGWLGEVCIKMHDFPRAWAWPSLLAAGSVAIPHHASLRSNIDVALVGDPGSGKSSCVTVANWLMAVSKPDLLDDYVGSAEGLAKHLPNEAASVSRLWNVDELGQLLDKCRIEGASFVRVLASMFYKDNQALIIARGKRHEFNCKMSIIGGIVTDDFQDAFSAVTAHGLYDRFIFGYAPTGVNYRWHPLNDYGGPVVEIPMNCSGRKPTIVEHVNGDVWELKNAWLKNHPGLNREIELALRCALIAASWDRRTELRAEDLGPALTFAEEQGKIRTLLRPNMGKNLAGEVGQRIMDYLKQHAPKGEWMRLRPLLNGTNAYRYGIDLANRVIHNLSLSGDIEVAVDVASTQKAKIIRWVN